MIYHIETIFDISTSFNVQYFHNSFSNGFYLSESIFKLMISSVLLRSFLSAQSKPRRRRSFERGWKTKGKQSHLLKSYFSRSKIVLPAISCYLWIPPIPLPMILAPTCSHLLIPSSSILERFRREFLFLFRRGNGDRVES